MLGIQSTAVKAPIGNGTVNSNPVSGFLGPQNYKETHIPSTARCASLPLNAYSSASDGL